MKIILGTSGSVAAKLTPKMVKALQESRHEIKVISTTPGLYFFDPDELKALGVEVLSDKAEWPEGGYAKSNPVPHIDMGDWADLLLIAPATFNTIGKIAGGIADNFLCCVAAAWPTTKPLIMAPTMNTRMWQNEIVAENLVKIGQRFHKFYVINPVEGPLACGGVGMGAMAQIHNIVDFLNAI